MRRTWRPPAGTPAEWLRLDGGPAPAGRFLAAAVWSSSANRLAVFGGLNNKLAAPPGDLWGLADAFGQRSPRRAS